MKKIILLLLALGIVFNASCSRAESTAVTPRNSKTYLIAGIDDAAENTDVLILASYNMTNGTATVVHIPRDTFCRYGENYRKINSIFPYERNNGHDRSESMSRLASYISDAFGVAVDGYFCIDRETLIETVDLVGGVDVELDQDLFIGDERGEVQYILKAGKNHLNGETAAHFVRYRRGYINGDLGRIDAQKLFVSALLKSVKSRIGIDEAAKMYVTIMPRITTNVGVAEIVGVLFNARINKNKKDADYVTLPGEAVMINNVSFYVIHRKSAAEIFNRDFSWTDTKFDSKRLLTDESNCVVENIYNH